MEELNEFFNFLYGEEKGFVLLALKNPKTGAFFQHHFKWPEELDKLVQEVTANTERYEVYHAPALFKKASGLKEDVLGANVVWVEFDGALPNLSRFSSLPEPTLRIRSSINNHEHWYWRIDGGILDSGQLERINRALTYMLGADYSGWDANQVLRPPGTINHKRSEPVSIISVSSIKVSAGAFDFLPVPPPVAKIVAIEEIPEIEEVVAKYAWKKNLFRLFREGVQEGSRSSALMALAYGVCEAGMGDPEALSVLLNADERWGKFSHRPDQFIRLTEIITKARIKYPSVETFDSDFVNLLRFGFTELLQSNIEVHWIWENFLQETGYFLLSGAPSVGKSQFTLNFAISTALGRPFLGQMIPSPRKIGYLSLEMPAPDLKLFLQSLSKDLDTETLNTLNENLILFPTGEPLRLTDPIVQKDLVELIADEQFDGLIVDSMMSATGGSVIDEKIAKELMDFNDRLRQRLKVFTFFIHHNRKEQAGNKKPNELDDIYGNVVITARATTVFSLWLEDKKKKDEITVIPHKVRLSKAPNEFVIYRQENLTFSTKKPGGLQIVSNSSKDIFPGAGPTIL